MMLSSGSFDAADNQHPRHTRRDDEHTATPSTPGLSGSQLSTPIMSQESKLGLILNTPPMRCSGEAGKNASLPAHNDTANNAATFMPSFPSDSPHHTPSFLDSLPSGPSALEPPAWKPPEKEEIEYADALNNVYNNQHHYLQPFSQDDSTIGSNQTNNSFTNNINFNATNALRPRGFSLCSYNDAPSVGSCPQPHQGQGQHRRHPSLPVSFFSSTGQHGSSQLFSTQESNLNQYPARKQYLNALQTTTKSTPYELHSHHHVSQVRADGAMAGLDGILLDLYMVDRSIDSSAAKMLATKVNQAQASSPDIGGISRKEGGKKSSSEKPRRTALGTLNDIQCILELHKVDKLVDRFKHDLQMPEFVEEEAWQSDVLKDLRKTDVEMEEYAKRKKAKETSKESPSSHEVLGQKQKELQYHFDHSDDEEEESWKKEQEFGGEGIYLSAESFLADHDAYQFFDPHETKVLQANSYQTSQVSASIHDNLHEVIDLLRTDAEVDGASRHHTEMKLIRPLLETDQLMNKWKERSEVRGMWDADLRALYMVDLEVDRAKMKCAAKPGKVEVEKKLPKMEVKARNDCKEQASLPLVDSTNQCTQEVKDMLSQHIPQIPQQFCPTSPELMPLKPISQATSFNLPPPVPMSSPQGRRAIFTSQEKSSVTMEVPQATTTKRSIFSRQEKTSAASHCAYQRGVMPGTTTVVMTNGGEMIDDIPVGKVVMR